MTLGFAIYEKAGAARSAFLLEKTQGVRKIATKNCIADVTGWK